MICHLNLIFFFITLFWHRPLKHCQESLPHKLLNLPLALTSASKLFWGQQNPLHFNSVSRYTEDSILSPTYIRKVQLHLQKLTFQLSEKIKVSTVILYGLSSKLKCCIYNVVGSSPLRAVSQALKPTELSKVLCNFSCAWGKERLLYKSAHLFPGCFIRALHLQNATKLLTCNQRKVCYDSKSQVSKIQPTNL